MNPLESQLQYPFGDQLPAQAQRIEVAPGIFWIRMPLPFALDHINLWLLRDQFEGEALAHLHSLWYAGLVSRQVGSDGVIRFAA